MKATRPKQRANLTVDAALLSDAKLAGINLSEVFERGLRDEVARRWLEENREAIESFNRYVEEQGTLGERMLAAKRGLTIHELRAAAARRGEGARRKTARKPARA